MGEIPDVIANETILVSWGNPIRDRVIQRYADATERTTLVPVPINGEPSWLEDQGSLEVYDGVAWVGVFSIDGHQWLEGHVQLGEDYPASPWRFATRRTIGDDQVEVRYDVGASGDGSGYSMSIQVRTNDVPNTVLNLGDAGAVFYVPITSPGAAISGQLDVAATTDWTGITIKAGGSVSSGGGLQLGASQGTYFARIRGALQDGSGDSSGGMVFMTRRTPTATGDSGLTDAMSIAFDGRVKVVGAQSVTEGIVRNIYTGTGVPAAGLGVDGDVYFRHDL